MGRKWCHIVIPYLYHLTHLLKMIMIWRGTFLGESELRGNVIESIPWHDVGILEWHRVGPKVKWCWCPKFCLQPTAACVHKEPQATNPVYCLYSYSVRGWLPFSIVASEVVYTLQSNSQVVGSSLKKMDDQDFLMGSQSPLKLASFLVWITTSLWSIPSPPLPMLVSAEVHCQSNLSWGWDFFQERVHYHHWLQAPGIL